MNRLQLVSVCLAAALIVPALAGRQTAGCAELKITAAETVLMHAVEIKMPDQLPHSRLARGSHNIMAAWLAGPTDRYSHGVLGDDLEASRLMAQTAGGHRLSVELPSNRVFEDLEPRLADMDADGRDEIITVESDIALGASLAVYGVVDQRLVRLAATPFLGLPNRWLNPLGVGDFDGDGRLDIALVATPHIGGKLRLYRYQPGRLLPFAEYAGVSTHRIGTTQLGLGRVIPASPRNRLLVPDQSRRMLMLLEWTAAGWRNITQVNLTGALASSLQPAGPDRWQFRLDDGQAYDLWFRR